MTGEQLEKVAQQIQNVEATIPGTIYQFGGKGNPAWVDSVFNSLR